MERSPQPTSDGGGHGRRHQGKDRDWTRHDYLAGRAGRTICLQCLELPSCARAGRQYPLLLYLEQRPVADGTWNAMHVLIKSAPQPPADLREISPARSGAARIYRLLMRLVAMSYQACRRLRRT